MTKKQLLDKIKKRYAQKENILSIIQSDKILLNYNISFKTLIIMIITFICLYFATTIEKFIFSFFLLFGFWFSVSMSIELLIHYFCYEKSYQEFLNYINTNYKEEIDQKKLFVEVDTLSWKNINVFITSNNVTHIHNIGEDLPEIQIFELALNIIEFNYSKKAVK